MVVIDAMRYNRFFVFLEQIMSIRVVVSGYCGRMGQEACQAIEQDDELLLVGRADSGDNLGEIVKTSKADVVVDLTVASSVVKNTQAIIDAGACPVIGTSGLVKAAVEKFQAQCKDKSIGGVIAPNFSIGAVLMMQFAEQAAKYLPEVEIIEMHHENKEDSPSGTAVRTAEMIAEARVGKPVPKGEKETLPGARGATLQDIPIHAVRLPGHVAHQQVIFGNLGETLTLRHDSINRSCFMPGIVMACKKVVKLNELKYGLEHILFA